MSQFSKCHICLSPKVEMSHNGRYTSCKCERCQRFIVDLHDTPRINEDLRPMVSGYIREYQNSYSGPMLTSDLIDRISKMSAPTIDEKIIKILYWMESKTNYPGSTMEKNLMEYPELISVAYAKNTEEIKFFIDYLIDRRFVGRILDVNKPLGITFEGLQFLESHKRIINSDLCFCAMSFDEEARSYYDKFIKLAVDDAGYKIERVDDFHHNEGIMDQVIALIRQSKFVIADLTYNKKGVYYEAGFARGLGRNVIFTCETKHFKDPDGNLKVHFDVRHLNFLEWSENDFDKARRNLQARIVATVGRGSYDKGRKVSYNNPT